MKPLFIVLIVIGVILFSFILLSYVVATLIFNKSFTRMDFEKDKLFIGYHNIKDRYERDEYSFKSKKNTIKAYLYKKEKSDNLIVYVHGMCPGHQGYLSDIMALLDRGYNVFTYDFTATGESTGKKYNGLNQQLFDLKAAIKFLKANNLFDYQNLYLYGHSMGGYAVACVNDSIFKGIVSISGFDSPIKEMISAFSKGKSKAFKILAYIMLKIKGFISQGFASDIKAHKSLRKSNTKTLIIHGTNDELVSFNDVSIISKKNKINNDLISYLEISDPMHNKHNTIIASTDCVKYQMERQEIFNKVLEETKSQKEANDAMANGVDMFKFNEANGELMDIIDSFYQGK